MSARNIVLLIALFVAVILGRYAWLSLAQPATSPNDIQMAQPAGQVAKPHATPTEAAVAHFNVLAIEPAHGEWGASALIESGGKTRLVQAGDEIDGSTVAAISATTLTLGNNEFTLLEREAPADHEPIELLETQYQPLWTDVHDILATDRPNDVGIIRTRDSLFLTDRSLDSYGLVQGDRITTINGVPVANLTPQMPVGSMLAGQALRFGVIRGANEFEVTVQPAAE